MLKEPIRCWMFASPESMSASIFRVPSCFPWGNWLRPCLRSIRRNRPLFTERRVVAAGSRRSYCLAKVSKRFIICPAASMPGMETEPIYFLFLSIGSISADVFPILPRFNVFTSHMSLTISHNSQILHSKSFVSHESQ